METSLGSVLLFASMAKPFIFATGLLQAAAAPTAATADRLGPGGGGGGGGDRSASASLMMASDDDEEEDEDVEPTDSNEDLRLTDSLNMNDASKSIQCYLVLNIISVGDRTGCNRKNC